MVAMESMAKGSLINRLNFRFPLRWCLQTVAILTTLSVLIPLDFVVAQDATKEEQENGSVLLPAPREIRRIMQKAQESIDEERWTDAVQQLGQILNSNEIEDFFNDPVIGGTSSESLKTQALQMLSKLPKSGKEAYDLLYAAEAKNQFQSSVTNRDLSQLRKVARNYLFTRSGIEASILLARLDLDQGIPLSAARRLNNLSDLGLRYPEYAVEVQLLESISWYRAGDKSRAVSKLKSFQKSHPNFELASIKTPLKQLKSDPQFEKWLSDYFSGSPAQLSVIPSQWTMYRGSADRNAESQGSEPLRGLNWHVRLALTSDDFEKVESTQQSFIASKKAALPMLQPLIVDQQVIMRTPWHLMGVDLDSGKVRWVHPWEDSYFPEQKMNNNPNRTGNTTSKLELFQQRIWTDATFGQFTSDGARIYFIEELETEEPQTTNRVVMLRQFVQSKPANQLTCLSIKDEGTYLWDTTNTHTFDSNHFAQTRFLGAPLPLENMLYCLVESNGEIRLEVLDSDEDGKPVWSQQLAQVDTAAQDVDNLRHTYATTPSYKDGILICPTNAGVVIAVDPVDRKILWGTQYKVLDRKSRSQSFGFRRTTTKENYNLGRRWQDSSVTIYKNRVIMTPPETERLICLDLTTGKKLWEAPREDGLYVGTIHQDKIVVVGHDSIRAFELTTGKPAWKTEKVIIPDEAMPSGRGFRSGDHYFFPTTQKKILKINVLTGKMAVPVETRGVLGNLVCFDKYVISQGVNFISSFKQIDALRSEVETLLAANPNDPHALREFGELMIHDGETGKALTSLKKSFDFKPTEETLNLYIQIALDALEQDFNKYENIIDELRTLIKLQKNQVELTRLIALGNQRRGEFQKSFDAYLAYVEQSEALFATSPQDNYLKLEDNHLLVDQKRWVKGQINTLYSAVQPELKASMEEKLNELISSKQVTGSVDSLRRFVTYFEPFDISTELKLKLAKLLIQEGQPQEAELILSAIATSENLELAGHATATLSAMFHDLGLEYHAAALDRLLITKFKDTICLDNMTGKQVVALKYDANISDRSEVVQNLIREASFWPYGQLDISRKNYDQNSPVNSIDRPLNVVYRSSLGYLKERVSLDQSAKNMKIMNPFGTQRLQIPLSTISGAQLYNTQISTIKIEKLGHLMVASLGSEIHAYSSLPSGSDEPNERLWEMDLKPNLPGTQTRSLKVSEASNSNNPFGNQTSVAHDIVSGDPIGLMSAINSHGICFQKTHRLICADPLTGNIHWERPHHAPGSFLAANENFLVVIPPNHADESGEKTTGTVIDMNHGLLIREVEVPVAKMIWTAFGHHLICWKFVDGNLSLFAYDPLTEKELWNHKLEAKTRGAVVDQNQVALMAPSGKFQLIDLLTGEEIISEKLNPVPELKKIEVYASQDQFQVLTYEPKQLDKNIQYRSIPYNSKIDLVNGYLYNFDRKKNELTWSTPEKISGYHIWQQLQSTELPVLVFVSRLNRNNAKTPQTKVAVALMLVDRRDGRVVFRDNLDMFSQSFVVSGTPESQQFKVQLSEAEFTFQFKSDDSPAAPTPPVGTDANFSFPSEVPEKKPE